MRAAGFGEGELIRAGFASADMAVTCDAAVIKQALKDGATPLDLKKKGCSALALAAAGASESGLA